MAVIVSLRDVVNEMEVFSDEHTAYINRTTGELITLSHEELALAEDPEAAAEAPQWQQDLLPKAREVLESEDFLPLPSKFEIHEWAIMERFADSLPDAAESEELLAALHGQGAFRRFKDTIQRLGVAEEWYRFREAALEEVAIEFLDAKGIAYRREPRQRRRASMIVRVSRLDVPGLQLAVLTSHCTGPRPSHGSGEVHGSGLAVASDRGR